MYAHLLTHINITRTYMLEVTLHRPHTHAHKGTSLYHTHHKYACITYALIESKSASFNF